MESPFWGLILKKGKDMDLRKISFDKWNDFLFAEILDQYPNTNTIIDSSSNLGRLKALSNSKYQDLFKLKVLYTTRDARGVVYSTAKKPGYYQNRRRPCIFRACVSWNVRNRQMFRFLKSKHELSVLHLRYEEFVDSPEETIRKVQRYLGIRPIGVVRDWHTRTHLSFAGNKRFRSLSSSEIQPDLAWVHCMKPHHVITCEILTGKLNRALMKKPVF